MSKILTKAAMAAGLLLTACTSVAPDPVFETAVVDAALSDLVADGSVAGVSGLVYRAGEEVYYGDVGMADREAGRAWERDTLVTIYSMTKPVTGVTLMSLWEEGLFDLEADLSDYLPEYADVKVYAGEGDTGAPILKVPNRPLKVIDIFRQTACFGYGWEDHPVSAMLNAAQVLDPDKPLSRMSEELADVPLYCEPGEAWKYGVAVDVQARLAEVVTGQPYEEIVTERVIRPLGLIDTSYFVPATERDRLAAVYMSDGEGGLSRADNGGLFAMRETKPTQINGGHGLISTIDDYMRFALMLQNEGEIDGVRILQPETVAFMTRDHLPEGVVERDFLPSKGEVGFGINVAVRTATTTDPE